ncbi:MAG TPA: DNA repair protein RecO [Acidimicrobiales bacterium]|nr:DNA repair protein RecO [Acidimicrobiales bacterium]
MGLYRDEGIALRTYRLGEADRIVSFLTPGHGKVRAVAKGVRKTKSRLGARVEPLSHLSLLLWQGRELDVVSQAEVLDSFRAVREDLSRLSRGLTMLEIADQVAQERQPAPELFALLKGALSALEQSASPVVLGAFSFKLLGIEGVGPVVDRCARCGAGEPLVAFDATIGGLLCVGCRRGEAVGPEVVALLRQVLSGGLARAIAETEPVTARLFEQLGTAAMEAHLDRRLRTARQLEDLAFRHPISPR